MSKPKRNPYRTLGVKPDASEKEIKDAFKQKAKDTHPDANPEDPDAAEEFHEVKSAYDLLMDPAKKDQWDNYGMTDDDPHAERRKEAIKSLQDMFLQTLAKVPTEQLGKVNVLDVLRSSVSRTRNNALVELETGKRSEAMTKRTILEMKKRLKGKKKQGNLFVIALQDLQVKQTMAINQIQSTVDLGQEMLDIIDGFEYEVDQQDLMLGGTTAKLSWVPAYG